MQLEHYLIENLLAYVLGNSKDIDRLLVSVETNRISEVVGLTSAIAWAVKKVLSSYRIDPSFSQDTLNATDKLNLHQRQQLALEYITIKLSKFKNELLIEGNKFRHLEFLAMFCAMHQKCIHFHWDHTAYCMSVIVKDYISEYIADSTYGFKSLDTYAKIFRNTVGTQMLDKVNLKKLINRGDAELIRVLSEAEVFTD